LAASEGASNLAVNLTLKEISKKYDRFSRWYDSLEGVLNLLGLATLRRRLIRGASGKVLEVAVGTGKNLHYYPKTTQISAVDLSREMLRIAQNRASGLPVKVSFVIADAERLPFCKESFDTVVSSLSSCTFPNPIFAFREMMRVSKRGGGILLLEHGRSTRKRLARFQDRHADKVAEQLGCHWNREPYDLALQAGFKILNAQRLFFGIFHVIEAKT
jgi:ubiquinone/menaquinone biosynthesis C-methylase UbiE